MIRRRIVLPLILPVMLLMALAPTASAVATTGLEYRILTWINQKRAPVTVAKPVVQKKEEAPKTVKAKVQAQAKKAKDTK